MKRSRLLMNSELIYDLQKDVEGSHPLLRFQQENDNVVLIGTIEVRGDEDVVGHFQIKVILPEKYPEDVPLVFEISNKLPKIQDRHFNPDDESACLFLTDERWKHWPLGASLSDFLSGPVNQFFLSQIWFGMYGVWIFGERGHAEEGIKQYYHEELGFSDTPGLKIALS